jgi:hypothetical protein
MLFYIVKIMNNDALLDLMFFSNMNLYNLLDSSIPGIHYTLYKQGSMDRFMLNIYIHIYELVLVGIHANFMRKIIPWEYGIKNLPPIYICNNKFTYW